MNRREFFKILATGTALLVAISLLDMQTALAGNRALNMWVMVTEEERESFSAAMQQLKEDFKNKAQIEVPINIELIPWATAKDRLAEALIDPDKAPDISQVGSTWVEWVRANAKLIPLELKQSDQFVPAALSSCPRAPGENRFYAVPWFVDVRAMYYNKQLYRDAPTQATKENWNWKVLEEACKKISKESVGAKESFFPVAFAGTREWSLLHDTVPWIWGANSVDDALSFIIHLANAYGNKEDLRLNRELVEGKFLRGHYAMMISGYWLIGRADDYKSLAGNITPDDIGILPIPAPANKKPYTFVGGSDLVLFDKPKRSKQATQVAKAFIQFLLEPEQQTFYSQKARLLPAQKDALASISRQVPHAKSFQQLLTLGHPYPARKDWAEIEFRLVKNLTLAWDFASGLYTCAQDPETNQKAKKTLSEIIALTPYWNLILQSEEY